MIVHQLATARLAVVSLTLWRLLKHAGMVRSSGDAEGVGFS